MFFHKSIILPLIFFSISVTFLFNSHSRTIGPAGTIRLPTLGNIIQEMLY